MATQGLVNFDGVPWSLTTTPTEVCFRKMSVSPTFQPTSMPTQKPSKLEGALLDTLNQLKSPTAKSTPNLRGSN